MKRGLLSKRPFLPLLGLASICLIILLFSSVSLPADGVVPVQAAPDQLPQVSFVQGSVSFIEPNDSDQQFDIEVKINRAPAAGEQVTVTYATADGSAQSPGDYLATTGQLTFPVGETDTQTLKVTIRGNTIHQPNRNFTVFLTNPENATVTAPGSITVTIVDNDPAPSTATPTPGDEVFVDNYEPNNELGSAYTTSANAEKLTDITLWPVGDVDYFRFYGKKDSRYQIFTTDVTAGLDTLLKLYNPEGEKVAENDDVDPTNTRSQVEVTAKETGFYFVKITNKEPSDSTNKTYSFGVNEILPPTVTPTATRIGQPDTCEPNNSRDTACLIGAGSTLSNMNFIPPEGTGTDNDWYVMPVKPGILYTCETLNLSAVNDTNIIFLDNNGNDFNPQLGNDDRALGDKSSLLSWYSTYQGNLNILVGPVNPPSYENSPQYTYDIQCSAVAATPTPPPTPTVVWRPPSSTGPGTGVTVPTATPFAYPTFPPTPTAIDFENLVPTQAPPPIVGFEPLPTATPASAAQQTTTVQITIYYDSNFNFTPELTEGIMDVAVELYDNATGELLAFGYSNEAGAIRFDSIASSGAVRVEVPFLNYSQVITGVSANILLRVEPRPLPSGIP